MKLTQILQILWVNMVTTVTLAIALAFEPAEKNIMQQKPRNPKESLISKILLWRISFISLLFVICMFGLFIYLEKINININTARTMVVNLLVTLEAFYLINCRRIFNTVLNVTGLFGSKPALLAIGIVFILQLIFTYMPFMQFFFHTHAITLQQWSIILITALAIFITVEFEKFVIKQFRTKNAKA